MELTEKQKNRLLRMAKIADDGELGILEELNTLFDFAEEWGEKYEVLLGKINDAIEIAQTTRKMEGKRGEKGEKGDKGDRGEPGKDGKDGKDGLDGKDGVDGRDGMDGKDGRDGKDGANGKDAELNIEELEIEIKNVKNLEKELKRIENLPRGGAARRVFIPYRDDLSASCDGSNKTFYLSRAPLNDATVQVFGTDFPMILRPTIDFTIANKTLTLTAAVPAPSNGATLICTFFS